jgi:glyoxylate/succinic semialdehyde reductase
MTIGFIGLGLMGSRMANRLIDKENELIIYNRTKDKAEDLIKKGAKWARSAADVGREAEVIFTMLANPEAVRRVAFGEEGFVYQLEQKSIWVDCSTVNPSFSKEMAKKAESMNVKFVDAPAAGTITPAEKGELIFFVGGEDDDVEKCRPLFEKMGKKIMHFGKAGMGTSMKMVVNLILGQAMTAFSEGMLLGESFGFSKNILFDTLLEMPVTARFIKGKREKLDKEKFETEFPLELMYKDFQLAALSGYENNLSLPLTNTAKEVFGLAKKYGFGEEDFSAVYKFLKGGIEK